MKNISFIVLFIVGFYFHISAQKSSEVSTEPLQIGVVAKWHSSALNEKRSLNIWSPYAYDSTKKYSVVYVLDGSQKEDFLHIAGLFQFFSMLFPIPEIIVVGIENVNRKRDFTFQPEKKSFLETYPTTGHSAPFIEYIRQEVIPYISNHYNTSSEQFLIGQSLGGLLATEILLTHPNTFSHYFIVSPSLWWDDQRLLKNAESLLGGQSLADKKIYVAVGADEPQVMVRDAKNLHHLLQKKMAPGQLKLNVMKGENHATILHNSIYQGLLWLYPYKEK